MEKVQIWFQPGDRREGFRWSATYNGRMVGLCKQPFCNLCNLVERRKLRGFRGGELEVQLTLHYRNDFWDERRFYLGHLVAVPVRRIVGVDEGLEFDVAELNASLYVTPQGAMLVDPGAIGFNGGFQSVRQLIAGQRVVTTLVSHGHLDHWNLLSEVKGPVFMTPLAFKLASRHAYLGGDYELVKALWEARMIAPGDPVLFEREIPLQVDTFPLPHSIPETMGLVIRGERARVVHLRDFKLKGWDPEEEKRIIAHLQQIAREGVDLLALTIFNAHVEGSTPTEALVIETMTKLLERTERRVIIACFSSNLERIRRIAEAARLLGRPVAFCGAGMENARELTGLKEDVVFREKAVIFATGCQAEEYSALWRIANNENPPFELWPDDTLVFSSRCIPGNEESLRQLIAALRPQVGRVIVNTGEREQLGLGGLDIEEALTHISGHASREDLIEVLGILKPKRVLPWPQDSPQIEAFREIARPFGIKVRPETERIIEV